MGSGIVLLWEPTMTEVLAGSQEAVKILLTLACAWFWMLGGRPNGRVYGRFVAPLFFTITAIIFHGWFGLFGLLYFWISTSGHHSFWRRVLECVCYSLPVLLFRGFGQLALIQILILAPVAAVIGHYNRQLKAPRVELLVNFIRVMLVI